ncbi:MAG: SDR family NAD(P)-dependent oxidoreductase [Acidiferrobacterales bacterium]
MSRAHDPAAYVATRPRCDHLRPFGQDRLGVSGPSTYCATRFAVVGLTENLVAEVVQAGARVFAACPGAVATGMQTTFSGIRAGMSPDQFAAMTAWLPGASPSNCPGTCIGIFE